MTLIASVLVYGMLTGQVEPAQRHSMVVTVNGEDVTFATAQPFIKAGHTLVPVRGVFEKIGARVDWDVEKKIVSAYKPGIEVVMQIGSNKALVNNEEKWIPMPAQIVSGSTMVPLRFLCETLGATVSYDRDANMVNIYVPQHEDDLKPGSPPPSTTGTTGSVGGSR